MGYAKGTQGILEGVLWDPEDVKYRNTTTWSHNNRDTAHISACTSKKRTDLY